MKPCLIAHIVHSLDYGGLENGLINLIVGLPAERYRHVVICMTKYTEFRERLRHSDVEVIALNKRAGKDLPAYLRLTRLLRRIKPDIVHTRNMGVLDCTLAAFLAGVPIRIHGHHGWDMDDLRGDRPRRNLLRRLCHPFVTTYVAVSKQIADWLMKAQHIDPAQVTLIYNGVDFRRFAPGQAPERKIFPSPPDQSIFVIGTVGRLETVKDQLTLAKAFVMLIRQDDEWRRRARLIIVGDGSMRGEIQSVLDEAGANDRACILGWQDDIPALMRQFDVFVLPSLHEGISNTLLEAMACGLPAIATAVGGNPELICEGESGFLVPPSSPLQLAEAISYYMKSPDIAKRHGSFARERAQRLFGLDKMLREYDLLYQRLLNQ